MTLPSEQTLLITGANGFVALHVIKQALERGYHVRGTVRSEDSATKVRGIFEGYGSQLSLRIVSDLARKEHYENAFSDTTKPITGVINVAAPFSLKTENIAHDLLDPAIKGAVGVLEASKHFGQNVKRIVNTSSFAAIIDLAQGYRPGYTYTEADWNPMTYTEAVKADVVTAYCASKGLAEKAMWDWVSREQPQFSLATISPPWVFGPHVGEIRSLDHLNESSEALWRLIDAKEVPPTDFAGFADVRVVAMAHLEAFERFEAGGQRFIVGTHFDYQSAVDALREDIPELRNRLPRGNPGAGKLERVYAINGEKAEKILGIKYTPLNETMKEAFVQLLGTEQRILEKGK